MKKKKISAQEKAKYKVKSSNARSAEKIAKAEGKGEAETGEDALEAEVGEQEPAEEL